MCTTVLHSVTTGTIMIKYIYMINYVQGPYKAVDLTHTYSECIADAARPHERCYAPQPPTPPPRAAMEPTSTSTYQNQRKWMTHAMRT